MNDWTHEHEQLMRTELKKRWHRVQKLLARGYDEDDLIQEMRIRLWRAIQRFDPTRGYPLAKWLSYQADFCLRDFERGRYA